MCGERDGVLYILDFACYSVDRWCRLSKNFFLKATKTLCRSPQLA